MLDGHLVSGAWDHCWGTQVEPEENDVRDGTLDT